MSCNVDIDPGFKMLIPLHVTASPHTGANQMHGMHFSGDSSMNEFPLGRSTENDSDSEKNLS